MTCTYLRLSKSISKRRKKSAGFLTDIQNPSHHTKDETLTCEHIDTEVENRDRVGEDEIPVSLLVQREERGTIILRAG